MEHVQAGLGAILDGAEQPHNAQGLSEHGMAHGVRFGDLRAHALLANFGMVVAVYLKDLAQVDIFGTPGLACLAVAIRNVQTVQVLGIRMIVRRISFVMGIDVFISRSALGLLNVVSNVGATH